MAIALLVARLILALVFTVAGLAKLADLAGSQQALRDFGIPAPLARPFGMLLPIAELAIALALIPVGSAWWGALGALILLLLFVAGISYNLAYGRTPDCHCFGQLHSSPVGWPTLLRNLILALIAGFVIWQGRVDAGASAFAWLGLLTTGQQIELVVGVILVFLLLVEGWLLFYLLRQNGRLLVRLEALESEISAEKNTSAGTVAQVPMVGLSLGTLAPTFALPGIYGETITLGFLRATSKPVVLVFSDPACGPCGALLPEVGRWQREYTGKLTLALVSRGTLEANRARATEQGITYVLLQQNREVAEAYKVQGTPSAVLVRPDGMIGSALAQGADAIRSLVAGAVGLPMLQPLAMAPAVAGNGHATVPSQPLSPKIGDPAPRFTLPDLSGKPFALDDFHGERTVVLFWNPGCGFCQRMLEDLKAWEANPPEGSPTLLVVSTGTVEANKVMDLHSPVVLDQDFKIGRMFGANGTPMAVLVDAQGNIASEVAAGAPAVFELIKANQDLAQSEISQN